MWPSLGSSSLSSPTGYTRQQGRIMSDNDVESLRRLRGLYSELLTRVEEGDGLSNHLMILHRIHRIAADRFDWTPASLSIVQAQRLRSHDRDSDDDPQLEFGGPSQLTDEPHVFNRERIRCYFVANPDLEFVVWVSLGDPLGGLLVVVVPYRKSVETDQVLDADWQANRDPFIRNLRRWLRYLDDLLAAERAKKAPPTSEGVEDVFAAGLVEIPISTETIGNSDNGEAKDGLRSSGYLYRDGKPVGHFPRGLAKAYTLFAALPIGNGQSFQAVIAVASDSDISDSSMRSTVGRWNGKLRDACVGWELKVLGREKWVMKVAAGKVKPRGGRPPEKKTPYRKVNKSHRR
jgi:hypothetical protein